MRVLIVTIFLACATAAPSGIALAPVPVFEPAVAIPAIPAIPAVVPTIPPGDIEAAEIDAKVFAEDNARGAIEREAELASLAEEQRLLKIEEEAAKQDRKEKNDEAFWSAEEEKWQAYDAASTAQARLDGAIANKAPAIARSTVWVPPASFAKLIYPSGVIAPDLSAFYTQAEPAKEEPKKDEAGVKTADIPADTSEKAAEPLKEETAKPATPIIAPFVGAPWALAPKYSPFLTPVVSFYSPGLKAYPTPSLYQFQGHYLTPTTYF